MYSAMLLCTFSRTSQKSSCEKHTAFHRHHRRIVRQNDLDAKNYRAIPCEVKYNFLRKEQGKNMAWNGQVENDERAFVEFRRKVRSSEVLSAAVEQLLRALQFTGKLSVVVQNGRVLKSGYEEGYFRPPVT